MTEGNIATWRVKEGDKFTAGDVLLEIETDKATMDVEAQEDGIVMKIMQGDGSKGVQVGARIAVIAEADDDISALEIPAEGGGAQQSKAPEPAQPAASESQSAAPTSEPPKAAPTPTGRQPKQAYPLLPSVIHLLKQNGLDQSVASNITPTGPNGRLLKGDVLAYLGKINAQTPANMSSMFQKASHLDLSNIKIAKAEPKPPAAKPTAAAAAAPAPAPPSVVKLPVSLEAVIETQRKIEKKLGVFLPLSTFIERATDIANDELPLAAGAKPTADELFNQILGLDKVAPKKSSRGSYIPQILSAIPQGTNAKVYAPTTSSPARKTADIYDILSGSPKKAPAVQRQKSSAVPIYAGPSSAGPSLFSLQVPKAEEKRAKVFLERVKLVLEQEPGRLVL